MTIFEAARNTISSKEYHNAVITVCLMCTEDTLNSSPCTTCPVKKSVDYWSTHQKGV